MAVQLLFLHQNVTTRLLGGSLTIVDTQPYTTKTLNCYFTNIFLKSVSL